MANKKDVKSTVEYARFLEVRKVIQDNKKYFVPGVQIPSHIILTPLGIKQPNFKGLSEAETLAEALSFGRIRSSWLTRFNRILAQRGLYMSQSKGTFYIKTKAKTADRVQSFIIEARGRAARAAELQEGITNYGSKYSKVKAPVIAKIVSGIIAR